MSSYDSYHLSSDSITDAQSYWSGFSDESFSEIYWENSLSHSCSDIEDVDTDVHTFHTIDEDSEDDITDVQQKKKRKL